MGVWLHVRLVLVDEAEHDVVAESVTGTDRDADVDGEIVAERVCDVVAVSVEDCESVSVGLGVAVGVQLAETDRDWLGV